MIFLGDSVLEECRTRAALSTSELKAANRNLDFVDLLTINYQIELCYAEKRVLEANPLLRYLQ